MKNTEDCVSIYLVSTQNGTKKSEFCVDGGFYRKGNAYYITYTEHEATGIENSKVFLKICENTVTMRRMGDYKTAISYIAGKETEFDYKTPFGEMKMKIRTSGIENKLSDEGGTLKIFYTLLTGEKSENTVSFVLERRRDNV